MAQVIFGALPQTEYIDADVIRSLRAPDGKRPCKIGLKAALSWIGNKRLKITEKGIAKARQVLGDEFVDWVLEAMGLSGYGYGSGSGSGSGSGYGYGYGDGDGSGYGDGYGSGSGYGYGYGSGSGYGYGYGDGSGYGYGDE